MLNENFKRALALTKLIHHSNQKIETFWTTEIEYLILSELTDNTSCLRNGKVICEKPRIISRDSHNQNFKGFSDESIQFAEKMSKKELSRLRLLGYTFQNKLKNKEMQELPFGQLLENVQGRIKKQENNIAVLYRRSGGERFF